MQPPTRKMPFLSKMDLISATVICLEDTFFELAVLLYLKESLCILVHEEVEPIHQNSLLVQFLLLLFQLSVFHPLYKVRNVDDYE